MRSHPPRYFGLMNPLPEQIDCAQSPLLQLIEVPSHSRRITYDENITRNIRNVTILFKGQ